MAPKAAPTAVPLKNQLCFSLYAASLAITRAYKPVLDRSGITYPQYLVLSALWEQDNRSVGNIADHLSLESSTITPLVKRLETAGLMLRQRNPADERQVLVQLTNAGRALQADTACLGELLLERSGMGAGQLAALNDQVQSLREALTAPTP